MLTNQAKLKIEVISCIPVCLRQIPFDLEDPIFNWNINNELVIGVKLSLLSPLKKY